jgi:hypothetical protein
VLSRSPLRRRRRGARGAPRFLHEPQERPRAGTVESCEESFDNGVDVPSSRPVLKAQHDDARPRTRSGIAIRVAGRRPVGCGEPERLAGARQPVEQAGRCATRCSSSYEVRSFDAGCRVDRPGGRVNARRQPRSFVEAARPSQPANGQAEEPSSRESATTECDLPFGHREVGRQRGSVPLLCHSEWDGGVLNVAQWCLADSR